MMYYFVLVLCGLIISTANGQRGGSSCRTPNGENAQCISIYTCSLLSRLVTTARPADVRFLRESQCGFANGAPLVCCGTSDGYRTVTQTPPRRPTNSQNFVRNTLLPDRSNCGFQDTDRILGGTVTELLEFPWMALLQYRKNNGDGYTFSCGGALINNRYVLTAAHCVTGAITQKVGTLTSVRLGEYDTMSDIDCIPPGSKDCNREPIDVAVEEAFAHQEYDDNSRSRYHDIALIRLAENVPLTSSQIKAICLPTSSSDRSNVGIKAFASGWGRTESANYSAKKLKVGLPIVANNQCARTFRDAQVDVADTQMCAGGEANRDSCNGDSGGPLMTTVGNNGDQWIVEGVVSFGTTCGTRNWPGIYTRVSEYLPWIHENVRA